MLGLQNILRLLVMPQLCLCLIMQPCFAEPILVIANAQNSNHEISKTEAINIFMGRYRQFADGQTAKPIDNQAHKNEFYEALVNKNASQINAYWARLIFSGRTLPPATAKDSIETIDAVMKESNAIAYLPSSQLDKNNLKVKVLLILEAKP